jgi:hypothetical protein
MTDNARSREGTQAKIERCCLALKERFLAKNTGCIWLGLLIDPATSYTRQQKMMVSLHIIKRFSCRNGLFMALGQF